MTGDDAFWLGVELPRREREHTARAICGRGRAAKEASGQSQVVSGCRERHATYDASTRLVRAYGSITNSVQTRMPGAPWNTVAFRHPFLHGPLQLA